MPIVTQTLEEKIAVLKQDTRDYIERVDLEFKDAFVHRTGAIQYADAVQFIEDIGKQMFSAEEIVNGYVPGREGRTSLVHGASLVYDAQQLAKRWQELPTRGQNGPELDNWE